VKTKVRCRPGELEQPRGRPGLRLPGNDAAQEQLDVISGCPEQAEIIGIDGLTRCSEAGPCIDPGSPLGDGSDAVAVA
jgi:hypothetical protein